MTQQAGISDRVLNSLVEAGLITLEQVSGVRQAAVTHGVSIGDVLAERNLATSADIASALEDSLGVPRVDLSSYAPEPSALALIPGTIARGRRVLPLFEIEGILTVAIGDPVDAFVLDDVAAQVGMDVEPVLADLDSVIDALEQYYALGQRAEGDADAEEDAADTSDDDVEPDAAAAEEPEESGESAEYDEVHAVPEAPSAEEPAVEPIAAGESIAEVAEAELAADAGVIDLDVLAVADTRTVAVLVTDILEHAVRKDATRIHLLPYKDDFFLVYRLKSGLEKVASAPLSMQGPLVDGFKSLVRLGAVAASAPALGRMRTRVADKDLVLTCSVVPTIAGQRLVLSIAPHRPQPRSLAELGMSEAEVRALGAMVERGRGILLMCAPVAGGVSSTYYALLAHAASVGKTVYSVEEAVEYEIPAVAQVMMQPGGPSPAAYMAAGLRQDTDVMAIDGLRGVDDVHLAVQAAGLGKLVIATFPAADIASGVRRLLDSGVEPHGLAAALTLGVGQRLVRTNCPNCSQPTDGRLAALIPGADEDIADVAGTGCPNCGKSGFRGMTAVFEILPFAESMRSTVAGGASADAIAKAAQAAGMRPLIASGLGKVKSGLVSAEELDRVLRFSRE